MLPVCRTEGDGFAIPTFEVVPKDVEGFMDELQEFQSAFHDCFARSEPRAHFFDYMIGQCSHLERKSIEPMALRIEGGTIRGMQRFMSESPFSREPSRRRLPAGSPPATNPCHREPTPQPRQSVSGWGALDAAGRPQDGCRSSR